jgi:hypothetical protein
MRRRAHGGRQAKRCRDELPTDKTVSPLNSF